MATLPLRVPRRWCLVFVGSHDSYDWLAGVAGTYVELGDVESLAAEIHVQAIQDLGVVAGTTRGEAPM